MRLLLLIAVSFIAVLQAFPMCTDGQTPLMEANDAFTCDRGCPVGFNCEFQDPGHTLSKAICCANVTALQLLYGDEDHSEPIWNMSEAASLSVGLQSPSENIPTPTKKPEYKAPSIAPKTMEEVNPTLTDNEEPNMQSVEIMPTESLLPQPEDVPAPPPPDSVVIAQQHLFETEEIQESNATDSTEPIESMSNELIAAMESAASNIPSLMELESTTLGQTHLFPTKVEIEVEGSGDLSENHSKLIQRMVSCERQQYRIFCHSGQTRTLATIRWWFNEEKGECEFYPFGYCPGDRIVESTTIRTKQECELRCTNMKIGDSDAKFDPSESAVPLSRPGLEDDSQNGAPALFDVEEKDFTVQNTANATELQYEPSKEETSEPSIEEHQMLQIHHDPTESTNLIAVDDPRSVDNQALLKDLLESHKEVVESATSGPAVTSEDPKTLAAVAEPDETTTIKMEATPELDQSANNENPVEEDLSKTNEISSKNQHDIQAESTEGIMKISPSDEKPGLLCSSTSYRFACKSGMPSQFVYRWEMVDGKCQSFPYGYCYGEFNHGHPRTPKECTDLCTPPSLQFFAL